MNNNVDSVLSKNSRPIFRDQFFKMDIDRAYQDYQDHIGTSEVLIKYLKRVCYFVLQFTGELNDDQGQWK